MQKINDIEQIKAEYLEEGFLLEPNFFNYRINYHNQRYYARVYEIENEKGELSFDVSVAPSFTAVAQSVPAGFGLMQWYKNMSGEEIAFISRTSAAYGTIFHVLGGKILRGETVFASDAFLDEFIRDFCLENGEVYDDIKKFMKKQNRNLLNDLIGFCKWLRDYKVKPIAMEYPVFSEKCAGTVDLVAHITVPIHYTKEKLVKEVCEKVELDITLSKLKSMKKDDILEKYGLPIEETFLAMIDYKTGMNAFYDVNVMQLHQYRKCWNLENPDHQIERIFNYGCDSYRLPGIKYRFKEQTDNQKLFDKWDKYVEIFHMDEIKIDTLYQANPMEILSPDNLENLIEEIDPVQALVNRHEKDLKEG